MRKLLVLLVLSAMLCALALPVAAAYKDEYKLDIVPSITTAWGQGAQYFADLVRERSGGKINIKVYANAQLTAGRQTNAFMLINNGAIDFACQSTINYSPQLTELNLFALPFFIASQPDRYKALDAITNGKAGEMIAKILEDNGVKFICYGENGFRELTNSVREIRVPADLKGLKIRVVGSPLFLDTFTALGANPLTMVWADTMSAIQTGTVDGQENPILTFYPVKVQDFHKFVTNWHYVADPTLYVVNPAVWASFTAEDQAMITAAAKEAAAFQIALGRSGLDDGSSLKYLQSIGKAPEVTDWDAELEKSGVKVANLTPEETAQFVELTKPVLEKWTPQIGEELVKAAEADMAAVR